MGQALRKSSRIAILGLPGGGKSTLLKRLATAYAFPERRSLIDDELPHKEWLPLLVRCRQLGPQVRLTLIEILSEIAVRAEMSPDLQKGFSGLVREALRDGTALLLIDGLDEISAESDRANLIYQLRTFLATYPNVALVLTSREAGFRIVGGALSSECEKYKLDDLSPSDIKSLTSRWYGQVAGHSALVRSEAERLAETILTNDRLLELAANPLLLTTLLLVKRCRGQLPTKRTLLYAKAIEVLLMTWNVEGHEPLDQDDAMPQLEYLAFIMMQEGIQRVSANRLRKILISARSEMPEILSYTRIGVGEFIEQVELRSGLLILSGHIEENGAVYPAYEFRHLTFQEYLVAKAVTEGHYPDRRESDDLVKMLGPHIFDEQWSEVIPLAAVLAGRSVQPLILELMEACTRDNADEGAIETSHPAGLLAACLCDEIQASPDLLRSAMKSILLTERLYTSYARIGTAKYGEMLFKVSCDELERLDDQILLVGGNILNFFRLQLGLETGTPSFSQELSLSVEEKLNSASPLNKALGCLVVMHLSYHSDQGTLISPGGLEKDKRRLDPLFQQAFQRWRGLVLPLLGASQSYLATAAAWALAWLAYTRDWDREEVSRLVPELIKRWQGSTSRDLDHLYPWIISTLPFFPDEAMGVPGLSDEKLARFFKAKYESRPKGREGEALLIGAYYLKLPWTRDELKRMAVAVDKKRIPEDHNRGFEKLMAVLGVTRRHILAPSDANL